jgi:spore coat polysaccharide biosynthesis protein SpsF
MKSGMIEKNKVIASIQVRTGSTRLPGKVLKKICGKPVLLLMLERLSKCKLLDEIIISTTVNKNDDPIVELAKNHGYKIFRGDEYDCLDRHYQAVKNSNPNIICKITPDCPLIDPKIVDEVIRYFLENKNKFDYVSNVHPATFPDGLDVEVFSNYVLEKTWKEAKDKEEREHTTTYMWKNPSLFRIGNVIMPNKENLFTKERWTVDYPEDFKFVKAIYENLYDNGKIFLMNEILEFLTKRKDIKKINQHLIDKNAVH